MIEDYYTVEQVSKITLLKKKTIYNKKRSGEFDKEYIRTYKKRLLFNKEYVENWVKDRIKPNI